MNVAILTLNDQNKSLSAQNRHLQANAYQLAETIIKHEKVNCALLSENEQALSQSNSVKEELIAIKQLMNEKDAEIKKLRKKYRVSTVSNPIKSDSFLIFRLNSYFRNGRRSSTQSQTKTKVSPQYKNLWFTNYFR